MTFLAKWLDNLYFRFLYCSKMFQPIGEVPFSKWGNLPLIVSDYYNKKLGPQYYKFFPDDEGLNEAITGRKAYPVNRIVLVESLRKQYSDMLLPESKVAKNIELLGNETTFTVTTGHQLSLFTGPLYFHYKIITAIKTAQKVEEANPGTKVVPIFWMASEDHDFEEIRKFHLLGKSFEWTNENSQLPTGRISLESINEVIDELKAYFRLPDQSNELVDAFKNAYSNSSNLAEATRKLINDLYGHCGVIAIDANQKELKELFRPIVELDVMSSKFFQPVLDSSKFLQDAGYKTQVSAREVNFFYINQGVRERIDKTSEGFILQLSGRKFSPQEMNELLQKEIENFSPNVIMRPLFQEFILPNIAYVGGPAEVNYWLQLKQAFERAKVFFPTVLLRYSAVIFKQKWLDKMELLGLKPEDLLKEKDLLVANWLLSRNVDELDVSIIIADLQRIYNNLLLKTNDIDKTLAGTIESEKVKSISGIENIRQKMLKAIKTKESQALLAVNKLFDNIHPEGNFQERRINILEFAQTKSDINDLIEGLNSNNFSIKLLKN